MARAPKFFELISGNNEQYILAAVNYYIYSRPLNFVNYQSEII